VRGFFTGTVSLITLHSADVESFFFKPVANASRSCRGSERKRICRPKDENRRRKTAWQEVRL
jgi:hypothetical protein